VPSQVRPSSGPRTPAQILSRAALTAASKAWSQNGRLKEEQRQAWRGAGAKIQSRPRLFQSGPLTGQQLFVGRGSVLLRLGRELPLDVTQAVASHTSAVEGLTLSYDDGQVRLKLKVPGPVVGDIMVFGAAPCSAGRKKWRTGAWLGLLPAPVRGESDITAMYVAKYGAPEPGQKVFIRIRGQRNGWKGVARCSARWFPPNRRRRWRVGQASRLSKQSDPDSAKQNACPGMWRWADRSNEGTNTCPPAHQSCKPFVSKGLRDAHGSLTGATPEYHRSNTGEVPSEMRPPRQNAGRSPAGWSLAGAVAGQLACRDGDGAGVLLSDL